MGVRQRLCREWALLALLLTCAQGWPPVRGDDAGRHMHAMRGDVRSIVTPKQQKTLPVGVVHTNVRSPASSTARARSSPH